MSPKVVRIRGGLLSVLAITGALSADPGIHHPVLRHRDEPKLPLKERRKKEAARRKQANKRAKR